MITPKNNIANCQFKTANFLGPMPFALCLLTFFIIHQTSSIAEVRYVSHTGTSTPPYTTWETAADSIQKAINICNDGDTVIVANGVYAEKITVNNNFVYLIGMSMDSCIIDGSNEMSEEVVRFNTDGAIENFTIKARGQYEPTDCVRIFFANAFMKHCKIINGRNGIGINVSSSVIENCIILYCDRGIGTLQTDTAKGMYINNVIISKGVSDPAILHFFRGSPIMTKNIIISESNTSNGVHFESQQRVTFKNNLIYGFSRRNVRIFIAGSDTAIFINNNSLNAGQEGFAIGQDKAVLRNNIIQNTNTGIFGPSIISSDYNLFNNVNVPVSGATLGKGNVFADPMFVNDTIPLINGSYDFHLQAYSPAIDAGDKNIVDVDGSRSDIGMYGGPEGERYEYIDLPPQTPKNFIYSFDSTYIILTLTWGMNTEHDFKNYNIYKDTISGFVPNEFNLIAQTDTSYFPDNLSGTTSKNIYYRITAVDSQDNESQPGNEIAVIIVGVNSEVNILRDYILYQNYPNPFNPSTKISYQIKERSYVKLMVYDIKGELIEVLVNKEQNSGYYEVEFRSQESEVRSQKSGGNLASGIYLYRIEVIGKGNIPVYSDMKKMILLK